MGIQYIIGRLKGKHSYWVSSACYDEQYPWNCANCGYKTKEINSFNCCPYCGSKMDGAFLYHYDTED